MKKLLYLFVFTLLSSSSAIGQNVIKGVVTAVDGLPLIGVTVSEKGTNNGTITDIDGSYSISVKEGAMLVFSYTGYNAQTLAVDSRTAINLTMEEGVNLEEVVVTALGIERSQKALSFSATSVDGEDMATAREVNVANSLAGKVAGVNINRTATGAGGSTRITIRGNSSVSGNNQPLIVVDGVPIDNSNLGAAGMWGGQDWGDGISSVNPSDVESMTVLKGNAAGALYGYRASNGVILVTTKKGTKRKGLGVDFSSSFQSDNFLNTFDFQKEYGHGDRGSAPATQDEAVAFGLYSWGGKLGGDAIQFDGVTRPYTDQGDNLSRFYRTGNTYTNTLALSGGSDAINYRISGTALNNQDILPTSDLDRYTLSISTNAKLSDKLTANISGSYVDEFASNRPRLSDSPGNANYTAISLPSTININDLKGDPNKLGAAPDGTELDFNDNAFVTNPWWGSHQFEASSGKKRIFGNATLNYQLLEDLSVRGRISLDNFNRKRRNLTPYGTNFSTFGQLDESYQQVQEVNKELVLNYQKDITENFGVNVIVGGNQQRNFNELLGAAGDNFSIPFLHDIRNLPNAQDQYAFSSYGVNSVFGQLELAFNNNIYLTATGRNDWFSSLTQTDGSESNNSIFYPSVGASWVFSESLNLSSLLDYGKLRLGWANVGGATDPYQLSLGYGVFGSNAGQPLGGISGDRIPNKNLKPSNTREIEFGADLRFLKNRVGLDFAIYDKNTENDILFAAAAVSSGFSSIAVNVGEIRNQGYEVLLSTVPVKTKDLTWGLNFNFSHNNNTVVSLVDPEVDDETLRAAEARTLSGYIDHVEGLPYAQVSGFSYERDASGNIAYDEEGYPIRGEYTHFGTGVHPTTLGISNSLSFGEFTVSALIDMKMGGYIYSATNSFAYTRGLHRETLVGRENGVIGGTTVDPANVQDYYQRVAGITEEFVSKNDFGKLRELIITYRMPTSVVEKTPFSAASLSLSGRNLAILWSDVDNVDPESSYNNENAQGLEMFGVPQTRSIGINLNLKF